MNFRNLLTAAAGALLLSTAVSAQAEGWRFAPVFTDTDFRLEPTLALTLGAVRPNDGDDDSLGAFGLEANFNCGLLQSPDNRIRSHLAISRIDDDGVEVTTLELSPRYTVPVSAAVSIGVGPSLALLQVDGGKRDEDLFGYGVAAGLNYRAGSLYAGADLRYQETTEDHHVDFANWALTAKIGVNF
ncbi:MAG: hypothetical protein H6945_20360 [Zoogloeaceae bacterium]|nr:hypothetical protein [Rhodocyclaceae bacterium]MCP5238086.1 hypothetical protein [Zoogloeaceae bacterium]